MGRMAKHWLSGAADLAAVALAVTAVCLLALRTVDRAEAREPGLREVETTLERGQVQPVAATRRDGHTARLDLRPAKSLLLLLFREDCPACQQSKPLWEALADSLGDGVRVVALSPVPSRGETFFTSGKIEVWHRSGLEPLFSTGDPGLVPVSLVVSEGHIEFARAGVPSPADLETMRLMLNQSR